MLCLIRVICVAAGVDSLKMLHAVRLDALAAPLCAARMPSALHAVSIEIKQRREFCRKLVDFGKKVCILLPDSIIM